MVVPLFMLVCVLILTQSLLQNVVFTAVLFCEMSLHTDTSASATKESISRPSDLT